MALCTTEKSSLLHTITFYCNAEHSPLKGFTSSGLCSQHHCTANVCETTQKKKEVMEESAGSRALHFYASLSPG